MNKYTYCFGINLAILVVILTAIHITNTYWSLWLMLALTSPTSYKDGEE